jgi:lipopolysaccharide transport system permease protein
MRNFSLSPRSYLASLWGNWALVRALVVRDVVGRYRGSVLGVLWSLFHPLLMLVVYTFVFSVVFNARWNAGSESKTEFALVLFAGLIVFNVFTECVNRAPSLVIANANYVKKVIFPLEILPWVNMGAALFHALVNLVVWLAFFTFIFGWPHLTVFWLPLVVLPLILFVMGLSWFLASLGVYLRDVGQMMGIVTTMLLFLSPIFYPASALPERYRGILQLNPLTPAIEMVRDVLMWGRHPDFWLLAMHLAVALVVSWLGFAWFQKTRKGFADVI